jgi:hypothetical protein
MSHEPTPTRGGSGGSSFADNLTQTCQIRTVIIRHGLYVDAIQVVWTTPTGQLITGPRRGGGGGTQSSFNLEDGEYIAAVVGRSGAYIDQLEFRTNRGRRFGPYGGGGGSPFAYFNLNVGGFFGRRGAYLDQLGMFTKARCPGE